MCVVGGEEQRALEVRSMSTRTSISRERSKKLGLPGVQNSFWEVQEDKCGQKESRGRRTMNYGESWILTQRLELLASWKQLHILWKGNDMVCSWKCYRAPGFTVNRKGNRLHQNKIKLLCRGLLLPTCWFLDCIPQIPGTVTVPVWYICWKL